MLPLEESTEGGMQMKSHKKYGENEGKQCAKLAGLCTRHSGSLCEMRSDIELMTGRTVCEDSTHHQRLVAVYSHQFVSSGQYCDFLHAFIMTSCT